jgi:hypothetical protein
MCHGITSTFTLVRHNIKGKSTSVPDANWRKARFCLSGRNVAIRLKNNQNKTIKTGFICRR